MLNIRVRHIHKKGEEATKTNVRDALQTLLDTGEMPDGWQFMFVNWKNPEKNGTSWRRGWDPRKTSNDADEFNRAFARVVQDQIRMAKVRKL